MAAPHDASAGGGAASADDDAAAAAALPSDTLAALQLLRRQFPGAPGCAALPRLALVTQVYALVADRTAADRALSSLVAAGTLRRFRLCTGRDEYALMFAEEYNALVAAAAAEAGSGGGSGKAAFDAFTRRVLPACRGVAVATPELRRLLRGGEGAAPPLSERAVDDALAALMQAGLLTRATEPGAGALLFTAPNAGAFQRALLRGRAAVRAALARRPHRQALQGDIERAKLRGCVLPPRFVIRDMLGAGALAAAQLPAGTLLRLVARD